MNKKEYEEKRKALMDEAQALINSGDAAGAEEKMNEVKEPGRKMGCDCAGTGEF